jgi:hypothetical protein
MFDRFETWLKGACIVLGALILLGVVRTALQSNPLAHVVVPSPPTLPADTNDVAAAKGTNHPGAPVMIGTSLTNNAGSALTSGKTNATNNVASRIGTNQLAGPQTNLASAATSLETNKLHSTNESAEAPQPSSSIDKAGATNSTTVSGAVVPPAIHTATNASSNAVATSMADSKTNGPSSPPGAAPHGRKGRPGMPPDMAMLMGMGGPGPKLPELSPVINARIDKITDSEILAPMMHPQPMALLGIAGNTAFLRSPSGQTGLLKETETLGEIKLLRIGINRVLVEQDGQKKELTIFSGYGGESLLPKPDTSHETTK